VVSSVKSASQETKEELENQIFELAEPLLFKLYNAYTKIPDQTDKPDAAILLSNPPRRFGVKVSSVKIGIEITSVDPSEYTAYTNDKKFGSNLVIEQIKRTFEKGIVDDNPTKKIDVPIPENFIFDGVVGKAQKYESYRTKSEFDEIILLCFSNVICSRNKILKGGLIAWTNYMLSKENYPFDKVIFVSPIGSDPVPLRIYDKKMKTFKAPAPYKYSGATITCITGQPLLVDRTYNLSEKFNGTPLIEPRVTLRK